MSSYASHNAIPVTHLEPTAALQRLIVDVRRPVLGLSDTKTRIKQQAFQADATWLLQELGSWKQDPRSNSYGFYFEVRCDEGFSQDVSRLNGNPSASALSSIEFIPFVQSLQVAIHPGLALYGLALAQNLSTLQDIRIDWIDDRPKWHRRRRQDRVEFAKGVLGLRTLPQLEELDINCHNRNDPKNQDFIDQNLEDEDGVDLLCDVLRRLGQTEGSPLRRLTLSNFVISQDLFCDRRLPSRSADVDTATWPSLEELRLNELSGVAPSGKWYYTGTVDDEERQQR
ncbi:uncharacterized protein PG998_006319 [Apiospora kogelbergensis]|uniref:uncharacterized protein n=1 Tax=Apiospora kogelbergensis TaxID=1337665 RepID=UPI00312E82C3